MGSERLLRMEEWKSCQPTFTSMNPTMESLSTMTLLLSSFQNQLSSMTTSVPFACQATPSGTPLLTPSPTWPVLLASPSTLTRETSVFPEMGVHPLAMEILEVPLSICMKMANTDKLESQALDLVLDAKLECLLHLQGLPHFWNGLKPTLVSLLIHEYNFYSMFLFHR